LLMARDGFFKHIGVFCLHCHKRADRCSFLGGRIYHSRRRCPSTSSCRDACRKPTQPRSKGNASHPKVAGGQRKRLVDSNNSNQSNSEERTMRPTPKVIHALGQFSTATLSGRSPEKQIRAERPAGQTSPIHVCHGFMNLLLRFCHKQYF